VYLSARWATRIVSGSPGTTEQAARMAIRGEVLLSRGDLAAARQILERTTTLAPQLVSAQLQLALIYQQQREYQQAIERYRRVIAAQPNSVQALNNLAYLLGTEAKNPKDALQFAVAAAKLAPRDPVILDTLAWTQHLLGDTKAAVQTMGSILKLAPNRAEIRLHAAIIYAAAGARAVAEDNLNAALSLDKTLAQRPDVQALRQRLADRR
jgi:Tfp pilus assembly protein PilF